MGNIIKKIKNLFIPSFEGIVKQFKEPFLEQVQEAAIKEGKSESTTPINESHSSVIWIKHHCQAFIKSKSNFLLGDIQKSLSGYKQILKDFFQNKRLADLQIIQEKLEEQLHQKQVEVSNRFAPKKEHIKAQIKEIAVLLNHDRVDIQNCPKLNIRWKLFISGILIIGIVFAETFSNLQSFLAIPKELFFKAFFLAIGISFGTYTIGKWVVAILKDKNLSKKERSFKSSILIAIVLLAYLGISIYRQNAMAAVQATDDPRDSLQISKFSFIIINSLLFFGLIAVKMVIYPSDDVITSNKKNKALKKTIRQKEKQIDALHKKLDDVADLQTKEEENATKIYEEAQALLDQKVADFYNVLKQHQSDYNEKLAQSTSFYNQINSIAKEAIGLFIQQVGLYKTNPNQTTPIDFEAIQLENPFKDFNPIYDNELESMFNIKPLKNEKLHPFIFSKN